MSNKPILVAIDKPDAESALALIDQLDPHLCRIKIGKELFTAAGSDFVKSLVARDFEIFLDLKFHDIPNTVAKAVKAAADLGVWMVNVHASGGAKMMAAAKSALADLENPPLLIAVTVLTSMSAQELVDLGVSTPLEEHVLNLAKMAKASGLDGVVCSAQEASALKAELGDDFLLVTPGVRPVGADIGDQSRVVTPEQAIANGSDYLVIGRPITQADSPSVALASIADSLS